MAAYIIVRVEIKDGDAYKEYMRHSPRIIYQYGGRFIARGGETSTLEGEKEHRRIAIIEFPSLERAKAFYYSPEYTEIRSMREGKGDAQFVAVEGYSNEQWDEALRQSLHALGSKG